MDTKKSIPGFTAQYSFITQFQSSYTGTPHSNFTESVIVPAMPCHICNRLCLISPGSVSCFRCWENCGEIPR